MERRLGHVIAAPTTRRYAHFDRATYIAPAGSARPVHVAFDGARGGVFRGDHFGVVAALAT
jgi:hypothetical protein